MKGILITLEKRIQVLDDDYTENYKYTMFGHYDGMYVKDIDYMGEFCPSYVLQQIRDGKKVDKINDGISDRYTIKAIYPPLKELCKTTKKIDYEMWESEETEEQIQKEYPFVSCIIAHLSESCFKQNTPSNILKKIIEMIDTEDSIKNIRCAVYFSIGYSDIIILARMKHFSKIDNIIEKLNELKTEESEKWVSDLYTIMGFDKEFFSIPQNIIDIYKKSQEEMTFCVAFKIKAGFSLAVFKEELLENINITLDKLSLPTVKDIDVFEYDIYKRFGSIDINFQIKMPITLFPAFYCEECEGVFFYKSKFFKKYIRTIQVFILDDTEDEGNECLSDTEYHQLDDSYKVFLEEFEKASEKEHLPRRLFESVVQIMKLYRTLAEPKHGFEVKDIVKKAIRSFIEDMNIAIELLEANKEKIDRGKLIKDIEKAVTIFRSHIVTYLNDLHRSERSFIEGRTMTHPSIGASTKLLFSYNKFINKLAEKNGSKGETYSFIVVSGDCDQTKMHELFHFLDVWDEKYNHLFVVTIPEISLFDIKGTILRLSHECFHCLGNRQRKERTYYAMYAWAAYIAENVSDELFDETDYRLDTFSLVDDKAVLGCIKEQRDSFCNAVKDSLKKEIEDMYKNDILGENDKNFYSSFCVDLIIQNLGRYFVFTHQIALPVIYRDILKVYLESQYKILKTILENYDDISSPARENSNKGVLRQSFSKIGYYIHDININSDTKPDEDINSDTKSNEDINSNTKSEDAINIWDMETIYTDSFISCFSSIVGARRVIYAESLLPQKNEESRSGIGSKFYQGLENFPYTIVQVMSECFSDYQAFLALDATFEQFLIAFIYETRDIDKAMPLSLVNVLRIGIDLDMLFNISTDQAFDEVKKEQIRCAVQQYDDKGFQINVVAEEDIQRIEEILEKYQSLKYIGDVVKHYLRCSKPSDHKNEKFKKFYYSLGEVDILPKIYEFLNVEKNL